jgi:hypothetical protein
LATRILVAQRVAAVLRDTGASEWAIMMRTLSGTTSARRARDGEFVAFEHSDVVGVSDRIT